MKEKPKQSLLSSQDLHVLRALTPGLSVDMQLTTPTAPKRVKTHFIGMDLPNCLIFQFPNQQRWGLVKEFLLPESPVVVRYVLEGQSGEVVAFRANVLRVIGKPSEMVFTTIPETIQSMGLRAQKRSIPGIAVTVRAVKEDAILDTKGLIVDVSQGGCRLAIDIQPDFPLMNEGEKLSLTVETSGKTGDIKCVVRNDRQDKGRVYYGLQFTDADEVVNELLNRHLLVQ